jgi:hypothetical protein
MEYLTDDQIAGHYLARRGWRDEHDAQSLLDHVSDFLDEGGLGHRSAVAVARAANRHTHEHPAKPAPTPASAPSAPSAEELEQRKQDVMGGISDRRMPTAEEVAGMDMFEYADSGKSSGWARAATRASSASPKAHQRNHDTRGVRPMTGQLWSGSANPRDLTGRIGRAQRAVQREAEEREEVARLRAEAVPGSPTIVSGAQTDRLAATGNYGEADQIGITTKGQ